MALHSLCCKDCDKIIVQLQTPFQEKQHDSGVLCYLCAQKRYEKRCSKKN